MAGGLAAELAGAFGEPNSDALGVHLNDLALPLGALDQNPDAIAPVGFDFHSDLCLHFVSPFNLKGFSPPSTLQTYSTMDYRKSKASILQ